jgi:hypothetical protein
MLLDFLSLCDDDDDDDDDERCEDDAKDESEK